VFVILTSDYKRRDYIYIITKLA